MEYDEFLDHALKEGRGRRRDGSRHVPAFMPSGGGQDALFDKTLNSLIKNQFCVFDVRGPGGHKKALAEFALGWPACKGVGDCPEELHGVEIPDAEAKLLIVSGPERMPMFWNHLRKSSALHIGAAFPPFMEPQDRCIIVPDTACVCVLVKERDSAHFPGGCLEPVLQYTSDKSRWLG